MHTRFRSLGAAALVVSQLFPAASSFAVSFPDVATNHIYREQIEVLAGKEIIKGNPDGTFLPGKTVNRAELLIMLYRATGKNPTIPIKACFTDVPAGEWYSAVVCDAAKNGYVAGYSDGNFRPAKDVNRVEALKMIQTVFGFPLKSTASIDPLKSFTDVSLSAWYAAYMANAFDKKILPIEGQVGTSFKPDAALMRGEAAAYIFNALGLKLTGRLSTSENSSAMVTRSSRSADSTTSATVQQTIDVDFPFGDDGLFVNKKGKAYVFKVQQSLVASFDVEVTGDNASVECRLYKLDAGTSFSLEYYIGHVDGRHCTMRVSLGNGNYQMEIVPKGEPTSFALQSTKTTGDGNDGFREASMLSMGTPKTGYLEVEDHAEWYYFRVTKQEKLTVEVVGGGNERCLLYPMSDVDLYGFSGPVCNEEYDYPTGTYYVGVMRRDERDAKETFTVRLK